MVLSKFAVFVDLENCGAKVATLNSILEYVRRPRMAAECGTPGERVMFVHPNDNAGWHMAHELTKIISDILRRRS